MSEKPRSSAKMMTMFGRSAGPASPEEIPNQTINQPSRVPVRMSFWAVECAFYHLALTDPAEGICRDTRIMLMAISEFLLRL